MQQLASPPVGRPQCVIPAKAGIQQVPFLRKPQSSTSLPRWGGPSVSFPRKRESKYASAHRGRGRPFRPAGWGSDVSLPAQTAVQAALCLLRCSCWASGNSGYFLDSRFRGN